MGSASLLCFSAIILIVISILGQRQELSLVWNERTETFLQVFLFLTLLVILKCLSLSLTKIQLCNYSWDFRIYRLTILPNHCHLHKSKGQKATPFQQFELSPRIYLLVFYQSRFPKV